MWQLRGSSPSAVAPPDGAVPSAMTPWISVKDSHVTTEGSVSQVPVGFAVSALRDSQGQTVGSTSTSALRSPA